MKQVVFVTGNLNKVKYTSKYTHYPFEHQKIDLDEIQSVDLKKIVEHKAKQAYSIIKSPVLVEDTSLVFHALKNLPGPFIKFFVDNTGNPGLCQILDGFKDRSATAIVCFGLFDGKNLNLCESSLKGTIAKYPRGSNGFGWNPVFIPKGLDKTIAELTDQEFEKFSPRKKALKKLEEILEKYYGFK